jgi:hypothetical protein
MDLSAPWHATQYLLGDTAFHTGDPATCGLTQTEQLYVQAHALPLGH